MGRDQIYVHRGQSRGGAGGARGRKQEKEARTKTGPWPSGHVLTRGRSRVLTTAHCAASRGLCSSVDPEAVQANDQQTPRMWPSRCLRRKGAGARPQEAEKERSRAVEAGLGPTAHGLNANCTHRPPSPVRAPESRFPLSIGPAQRGLEKSRGWETAFRGKVLITSHTLAVWFLTAETMAACGMCAMSIAANTFVRTDAQSWVTCYNRRRNNAQRGQVTCSRSHNRSP